MIKTDNEDLLKLKECYDLAIQYEKNPIAKELLQEKTRNISVCDNNIPIQTEYVYHEENMQSISELLNALALEGYTISKHPPYEWLNKIYNIPDCAELEFVSALVELLSLDQIGYRLNAVRHIRKALEDVPNDPRYKTLAEIIEELEDL